MTVQPAVAVVPVVSDMHQRAERADTLAHLKQAASDFGGIAGNHDFLHEIVEVAVGIDHVGVSFPRANSRTTPAQLKDVLETFAQ